MGTLIAMSFFGSASTAAAKPSSPVELPPNVVAFVRDTPARVSTITLYDFHHDLAQWAARKGLRKVPRPGDRRYEEAKSEVLLGAIESADVEGQARDMGVVATPAEVAEDIAQIKRHNFKSHAEYLAFLKHNHYTRADVFERVRIQILSTDIQVAIVRGIRGKRTPKSEEAAFAKFIHTFRKRWRPKNICAPRFVVESCANAPAQ